ncbi:hypothetical protein BV25DRAFT_1827056 [Artomyces pyxidatus]|uniref:Uncharacterized protein n=1 Tax=Artomyces pyxidatus TaxID=48021 RepID=A0ACB8SYE4_9AGAM|nr:hypothetical protein BV25DRAFT_1827056 [Artomyces pyxidatus]
MSEDTETPQELIDINMFPPPKEMSAPPTPVLPSPPSAPTHSPSHNPAPSPPQSVPTPDVPIKPAESPAELSRQPSLTAAAMSAFVVPTPALSRTTSLDLSVPSAFAPSLPGSFSFTSASASFTTTSTTFSSSPFATPSSSFTSAPQPSPFAPSPFAPAAAEAYVTAPMPFRPTKTFDIPTAPTPPSSQSNAATPAPLTYDSFWNTHSTASGWRRTVGTGSGAATPIAGGAAKG